MKTISLHGSEAENIGHQHGEQLRDEIHWMVAFMHQVIADKASSNVFPYRGPLSYRPARRTLLKRAHKLIPYIPTPLLTEMKAISKAACVSFDDILLINTFDDLLYLSGCSSICYVNQQIGVVRHGRNLDYYRPELADKSIIMRYENIVNVGFAGYIGCLTATNTHGLSLSSHTSIARHNTHGTPTGILYRLIMQYAKNIHQAKNILTHLPRTVGNNVMVSSLAEHNRRRDHGIDGPETIPDCFVAEICAQGSVFRDIEIDDEKGSLWTTNHFVTEKMRHHNTKTKLGSLTRYQYITDYCATHDITSLEQIKDILSHDDGNKQGRTSVANAGTVQSVIFDPKENSMYVATGLTCPVNSAGYEKVVMWK